MKANHKYRVSVYLGKENYTKLEALANLGKISVSQVTRLIIDMGMEIADFALDANKLATKREISKHGN